MLRTSNLLLVVVLMAFLAGSAGAQIKLAGDLDGNQRVDFKDLRILAQQWLDPWCVVSDCVSDIDGANGVNFDDFSMLAGNWQEGQQVVINEIHYDPDVKTELVEFVELYNAGTKDANISGWYFSEGIIYEFPPDTILPVGGYVVVAQDRVSVQTKFGTPPNLIFGPFIGKLENDGEEVELCNAEGLTIDEVDYRRRFPWPIVGDPPGYSIELVNPSLDNDLGGSWRPSEPDSVATPTTLLAEGATFSYFEGYSEASAPIEAWREYTFNDVGWPTGQLPIGYGESFIKTNLNMRYNYTCVFLRKKFSVSNPGAINHLWLDTVYDDGWNAWINGKFVKGANVSDVNLPYTATAGPSREDHNWNQFVLPHPSGYLETENVLVIQLFNSSKTSSSDCFLDVRLVNRPATGSASPTPGAQNTTYSANIGPHMRQVRHRPEQPKGGQEVDISVKVTDPDGVQSVVLSYQPVYPGSYIEKDDPEYETNWTNVAMADDGNLPDEEAGDNIYTVKIPGALNTNRLLMRYRITATDKTGLSVRGPYPHDPSPNFAYFVYNGVPGWSGAIEPNSVDPVRKQVIYYDTASLTRVPVYYLITKKDSVLHSTWFDKYMGDLYKWNGTLVYDGEIYDHIRYRARGGVWRYAMGKNMWKFDFNRGHFFEARDDYGKKYDTTWDKLNFSACIQQGSFGQRGEQGMFEALSFGMFDLADVPAPKTHWIHYRVIDDAAEFGPTQYEGDFWGLYMVIEQMDGRFLDEHGLPDGNLYKMEARYGEMNNQGLTAVTDGSDIRSFKDTYETSPPAQWWGENVNLDCYYSYRAVYLAAHHGDITSKNHFFYLNPELTTNEWGTHYRWWQLPWDVDLTWTTYYGSMSDPFSRENILGVSDGILNTAAKNRMREFCDLFFNSDQMIAYIDELAAIISPVSGYSIVDADRAMWDYHWVMQDNAYPTYLSREASFKAGTGRFYEEAEERGHSRSFSGMVQVMKGYVINERVSYMNSMASDSAIPYTPTVTYTGAAGYPINALTFSTSPYNDPQGGGTFAAMKWRIGEVSDVTAPAFDPSKRRKYEIETVWDSGEITDFNSTIKIPASSVEIGHAYRVRVRMKDNTNRWSHWSAPIQFIVGTARSSEVLESLRITEVMYNPAEPGPGDPNDNDDFEFIELRNIGPNTIDLTYVSFVEGITFDFNDSSVTSLAPGAFMLVVRNKSIFEQRYGAGLSSIIAGEYRNNLQDNLANDGEDIKLIDFWNGTIAEFDYSDGWYPITDGGGFSLTMRDPGDNTMYVSDKGLEAHWKFDEGSGGIAADSVGSNNGTLVGNPTWTDGLLDGALSLDGSGDYVSVSGISALAGNNMTAQAWICVGAYAPTYNAVLTQHDLSNYGYYFYIVSGSPAFYIFDSPGYAQAASSETLNADQWYHIAGTNDGSELKLYVDGELKAGVSSSGLTSVDADAYIGCEISSPLYYMGVIDDVRIYNRPLSGYEFRDISYPMGRWSRKDSWRASVYHNGTPGADDSGILPEPGSVIVNEVMSHSNAGPDWVELYNTTEDAIDIGGWYLSDNDGSDADLMKYRIADGTVIDSNSYMVFYQDANFNNPNDPGYILPFAYSENGEKACLSSYQHTDGTLTGYREVEAFDAAQTNVSFGQYYKSSTGNFNFVAMEANTPGLPNADPMVGPIVISEIMYNPPGGDQNEEYIELHNIMPFPVTLYRFDKHLPWKFTDGIDYTFSSTSVATIPAKGYLLVVKDKSAFNARYGGIVPPGVDVVGSYSKWLDDDGEKLELSMPGDTDASGTHYIRIDRVNYSDGLHHGDCPGGIDLWPRDADGLGKSLVRKDPNDYGNDVINWKADNPSPGSSVWIPLPP